LVLGGCQMEFEEIATGKLNLVGLKIESTKG